MRMRLLWLGLMALAGAWPTGAQACRCKESSDDPLSQLQEAKDQSVAIYRARVLSVGPWLFGLFGNRASVEVLEVFKGAVASGDRLQLPNGGSTDCTIGFEPGTEYLMYARGDGPDDVYRCSRTQKATGAALEMNWLRTGMLPTLPVALQRESVSCEACDISSVGGRMLAAPGESSRGWLWPLEAEKEMEAGRPFLTISRSASDSGHQVMVGSSWDGKPFELTLSPHHTATEACVQKLQLRWCKRLDVSTSWPDTEPLFRCIEPGAAIPQCDESLSRTASWLPLEELPSAEFNWHSLENPWAELKAVQPLEKQDALSPVLVCRPGVGISGGVGDQYRCHMEKAPMPTAQAK